MLTASEGLHLGVLEANRLVQETHLLLFLSLLPDLLFFLLLLLLQLCPRILLGLLLGTQDLCSSIWHRSSHRFTISLSQATSCDLGDRLRGNLREALLTRTRILAVKLVGFH